MEIMKNMKIENKISKALKQLSSASAIPFIFTAVVLSSGSAQAYLADVCELKQQSQSGDFLKGIKNLSATEIKNYKQNLIRECALSEKFLAIKKDLINQFAVDIESLAEYQAMRFVQRSWYENSKSSNKPVEVIYQIKAENYKLPFDQQSFDVWDDWANGIKQIDSVISQVNKGATFDLRFLKKFIADYFLFIR